MPILFEGERISLGTGVPKWVDDGNFQEAIQNGPTEWRFPFTDKGDNTSFEAWVTVRQDRLYYRPLPPMQKISTPLGDAYLVEEGQPLHVGNGLLEWKRGFASVPITRTEGSTIAYSNQFLISPGDEPASIEELTLTQPCNIVWEYFLKRPDLLIAPKVAIIHHTIIYIGGWHSFRPGTWILAQDAEIGLYKGGIYYRKGMYIRQNRFF